MPSTYRKINKQKN